MYTKWREINRHQLTDNTPHNDNLDSDEEQENENAVQRQKTTKSIIHQLGPPLVLSLLVITSIPDISESQ